MASSAALLLRRTLSLSRGMLGRTFPATSATSSHLSPILLPPISPSPRDGNAVTELLPSRGFRSTSFSLSASRSYNNNFDDKIDEDTILFEGCDYKHWLITMDFPKDPKPSPEEMVETYVQTLAKVVGSVEEAKKRMYACSTTTYTGFQAEMDEETSKKFEGLPGVVFILPDSYIDPVNKEYGGDKYINGTIIPRPPPVHYGRPRRNRDQPQRGEMRNQQYGSSYGQQGSMQGDFRNFSPQQSPPQQNYGPPQNMTSQHRSGPPQSIPPQQNHSGAPQSIPPQQNYSGPPQNFPPQQNYSGPPQNFSPQQNYGGPPQNFPPQQNYCGPPQNFPPQQNYGGPPNFHPRPSYGQPPNYPSQQGYGPPIQEQRPNAMPLPNRDNRDVGRDAFQGAPYRGGGFNQGSNFSQEPREHTLGNQTGYTQSPRGFPENNQSYAPPSGSFDQGGGTYGRGPAVAGRYGQTPNSGYGTDNAFQGENKHPGSSSAKEENDDEQRNQRGQMGTGQGRY